MLPSNATAGYRWTFDDAANDIVDVVSIGYETSGSGVGSAGTETWTIHARTPGRAVVTGKYWRPWEGDSSIVERFAVTIDVAAQ